MADGTKIEWSDATVNAINGCSVESPGCTNCYAMRLAGTRMREHPTRAGLTIETKAGPVWNGDVRFVENQLVQPLRWTKPRMIFWNAHGDMWHPNVPTEWIDRCFAAMGLTHQHRHQVLTKRSARMLEYFLDSDWRRRVLAEAERLKPGSTWNGNFWQMDYDLNDVGYLRNVWLGVSVEDQPRADLRIPHLLATPAAVRWISGEPLLSSVDFRPWLDRLDWIVVGGENGPRPMHPDWARSIRDQCAEADVPFLFKQWGSWKPIYDRDVDDPDWRQCGDVARKHPRGRWMNLAGGHGFHGERVVYVDRMHKKLTGRLLDGVTHDGYPEAA